MSDALYQRIAESIADDIASGRLSARERLPTQRALAEQLGVAVPTVTRAYRELEQRGLIASTVGRGTFVTSAKPAAQPADLNLAVNGPARGEHERLLREALSADTDLSGLLGYEPDDGGQADRVAAAGWLSRRGVVADPDLIAITHGGQHAIVVGLGAVLRPGSVLLTDTLTYPGVKSAARLLGVEVVGVEMDADGIDPEALDAACNAGADGLYLMPAAHNPTAITLSAQRQHAIAEIARRHELWLIEDDVFGLLVPDADRPPPLAVLAPERTVYLTSLSKTIAPGLRWGAVLGPPHLADRLRALVRATILNPPRISADIARRWLTDGTAEQLVTWQREEMERRFAMSRRILGACGAARAVRTGGLHAWIALDDAWSAADVVELAGRLGIEISPTSHFIAGSARPIAQGVRLCLGNAPDQAVLADALTRLVAALDLGPPWSSGTRV